MPRYITYTRRSGGTIGQRAAMAVGLFLGCQLGSVAFTGHFLTLPALTAGGGSGTQADAAIPVSVPASVTVKGLPATTGAGSPWSIFTQGGGQSVAVTWAKDLLAQLGDPAAGPDLRFAYDWEVSEGGGGRYNPLNQGPVPGHPELTSTGQQYGGGAADYISWSAGLAGSVAYLHMPAYAGVLAALRHDDYQAAEAALLASPWAGSHYGWGRGWHAGPAPA